MIIEYVIHYLLMLLFYMANWKILIASLLDKNHSLAVVVSKHGIGKFTIIIIIKRDRQKLQYYVIYTVSQLYILCHTYLHLRI